MSSASSVQDTSDAKNKMANVVAAASSVEDRRDSAYELAIVEPAGSVNERNVLHVVNNAETKMVDVDDDDEEKTNVDISEAAAGANNQGGVKLTRDLKSILALSKEANLDTNILHKRKSIDLNKTTTDSDCESEKSVASKRKRSDSPNENRKKMYYIRMEVQKDNFCWRCHKDGVTVSCKTCPRSFHYKCIKFMATMANKKWQCPECVAVIKEDSVSTRTKLKDIDLQQLQRLLMFAHKRMVAVNDSTPFLTPVDEKEFADYLGYIVNPMDLTKLAKNIENIIYGSTTAFEADAKWILHNSIIYNSNQSKLTTTAKNILKICKQEMSEIENCSSCYLNANTVTNWFVLPCPKPHILLWAKLKGFPYWPAKAMSTNGMGCVDVRFFGAHDRAWVFIKDCFLYSMKNPNTNTLKKNDINECIKEVNVYIEHLEKAYGEFKFAPFRTPFNPDEDNIKLFLPNYVHMDGNTRLAASNRTYSPCDNSPDKSVASIDSNKSTDESAANHSMDVTLPADETLPLNDTTANKSPKEEQQNGNVKTSITDKLIKKLSQEPNDTAPKEATPPTLNIKEDLKSESNNKNKPTEASCTKEESKPYEENDLLDVLYTEHIDGTKEYPDDKDDVKEKVEKTLGDEVTMEKTETTVKTDEPPTTTTKPPIVPLKSRDVTKIISTSLNCSENVSESISKMLLNNSTEITVIKSPKTVVVDNVNGKSVVDAAAATNEQNKLKRKGSADEEETAKKLLCTEKVAASPPPPLEDATNNKAKEGGGEGGKFEEVTIKQEPLSEDEDIDHEYMKAKKILLKALNISEKTNEPKVAQPARKEIKTRSKRELVPVLKKLDIATISKKKVRKKPAEKATPKKIETYPSPKFPGEKKLLSKEVEVDKTPTKMNLTTTSILEVPKTVLLTATTNNVPALTPITSKKTSITLTKTTTAITSSISTSKQQQQLQLQQQQQQQTPSSSYMILPKNLVPTNQPVALISTPTTVFSVLCSQNASANNTNFVLRLDPQGNKDTHTAQNVNLNATTTTTSGGIVGGGGTVTVVEKQQQQADNKTDNAELNEKVQELVTLNGFLNEKTAKALAGSFTNASLPKLRPRPAGPLSQDFERQAPSTAGKITAKINTLGHKFSDYFRGILIETLTEIGNESECNEAAVMSLKCKLEAERDAHKEEIIEIKKNVNAILHDIQKSQLDEREKIVEDVRAKCELETIRRVNEAKLKQWCANCLKEAHFYCCWNANYCDMYCQTKHWTTHMRNCSQNVDRQPSISNRKQQSIVMKTVGVKAVGGGDKNVKLIATKPNSKTNFIVEPLPGDVVEKLLVGAKENSAKLNTSSSATGKATTTTVPCKIISKPEQLSLNVSLTAKATLNDKK